MVKGLMMGALCSYPGYKLYVVPVGVHNVPYI